MGKLKGSTLKDIDFYNQCLSVNKNIVATINVVEHTKIDETLNTYSHLFKNQLNDIVNTINKLT